jgi:hydroxymethylpyrimidine/phosphomethylpyrimidine kinase
LSPCKAAIDLNKLGSKAVVVKGGALSAGISDDCLVIDDSNSQWLKQEQINTKNLHGAGCTFSSAFATFLDRSYNLQDAVKEAKDYLTQALIAGADKNLRHAKGPVMHFIKT